MSQQHNPTEDYNSSSEDETAGHAPNQALPIANLPSNFDGIPQDGMEYLFTVRRDSRLLPRFTRAPDLPVSTSAETPLARDPPTNKTLHTAFPTEEWRTEYVVHFLKYRKNLRRALKAQNAPGMPTNSKVQLPSWQKCEDWWHFITGPGRRSNALTVGNPDSSGAGDVVAPAIGRPASEPHEPTLSLLKQFSTRNITFLLYWFSVWIGEDADFLEEEASRASTPAEDGGHVDAENAPRRSIRHIESIHQRWIFALLGVLDTELVGNDISTLRVLARSAIRLAQVVTKGEEIASVFAIFSSGEAAPQNDKEGIVAGDGKIFQSRHGGDGGGTQTAISGCWMVVAAIVGVWGQRDIWDEAREALSH